MQLLLASVPWIDKTLRRCFNFEPGDFKTLRNTSKEYPYNPYGILRSHQLLDSTQTQKTRLNLIDRFEMHKTSKHAKF